MLEPDAVDAFSASGMIFYMLLNGKQTRMIVSRDSAIGNTPRPTIFSPLS